MDGWIQVINVAAFLPEALATLAKQSILLNFCRRLCVCMWHVQLHNNWKTIDQKLAQLGRNMCYRVP